MNTAILRALLHEEWSRVRAWLPWAILALAAYPAILALMEPHLHEQTQDLGAYLNGFALWCRRNGMPVEVLLLPALLTTGMFLGILATYDNVHGLSLGIPGRYLVLPMRSAYVYLFQCLCRIVFALPFAFVLASLEHVLALGDELPAYLWCCGVIVGIAGSMAAACWWRKLGSLGVMLWLGAPLLIWCTAVLNVGKFSHPGNAVIALVFALLGLLSGAWLLERGGAFETFFLTDALYHFVLPFAQPARLPFGSAHAALRWYARPHFAAYVVPASALAASVMTAYAMGSESRAIAQLNWLPWTPSGIRPLAMLQVALGLWGYYGVDFFSWIFGISAGFEGVSFLRQHVLRRPFNLHLPATSWALARDTALGVFGPYFKNAILGTVIFAGAYYVASLPNVGAQYAWPETRFNTNDLLDPLHNPSGQGFGVLYTLRVDFHPYNVMREHNYAAFEEQTLWPVFAGFTTTLLVNFLLGWTAFWQVMWVFVPVCWSSGLENAFLVAVFTAVAIREYGKRRFRRAALCLFFTLAVATNYSLWLTYQHASTDDWLYSIAPMAALLAAGTVASSAMLGKGWRAPLLFLLAFTLLAIVSGVAGLFLSYELEQAGLRAGWLYGGLDSPAREVPCILALALVPALSLWGFITVRRHR